MTERREATPWALLAQDQSPRTYVPGQLIYLQGTEADTFFYLLSGSARSYISSETGDERVLTTHRSGDLMGEAAFFDGCPRVSSAVAVTECRAVSIDRERLDRVLRLSRIVRIFRLSRICENRNSALRINCFDAVII